MRVAMILVYDLLLRQYGGHRSRILIYGVNDLSMSLKLALHTSKHYQAVAFVIPSKKLCSYQAADLPIFYFEDPAQFAQLMDKYKVNGILFPDEAAAQKEADNLIPFCEQHGIKSLVAPSIDLQKGGLKKTVVRDVRIEDLLGRKEIVINLNKIIANFCDKTIMVTGGAGSIGSELCRQLASFDVKRLVIFDNAETPLHLIRLELEKKFPNLDFVPFIGDVRDENRLEMAFQVYKPQVVFHAAAYKHVPLMEENPCEAIRVNVMGSRRVAEFCVQYEVEKMVMISTDKAVNPTNVMGASKRLAEIYVQSLGLAIEEGRIQGKTHFVTTRFGNVLGSNGSVIPFFRRQINEGGPVTVTHKDIVRFFMTIPEACRLVMEAATMSKGNDIFVFDMGKAVKIADMARRMIRLAGYVPDEDIEIQYTGLRPGEKLYEEVLSNEENTKPTGHEKIRTAEVRRYVYEDILPLYDELALDARGVEVEKTVRQMKKIVPEYKSNNSVFEELDKETGLK